MLLLGLTLSQLWSQSTRQLITSDVLALDRYRLCPSGLWPTMTARARLKGVMVIRGPVVTVSSTFTSKGSPLIPGTSVRAP